MTKRNLPTLEDVARLSEVSTATVSRCLNEPEKVSDETRIRVMAAVNELHYAPNFGARAIAANRTGTYGVVIPTMENAIFAQGIEAFQKVLVEANTTMLLASSSYDSTTEANQTRTLVARGADGMLLIGNERQSQIKAFLKERQIASVNAWCCSEDPDQPFVGFDNIEASEKIVSHAISLGHRSLAYLSGYRKMNDRAADRVTGAKLAIKKAGLNPDALSIVESDYSISGGQEAFFKARRQARNATLIICGNDVLAVGAVQGAQASGLEVPKDISIVGFDDIELATIIRPALTTVHVPHQKMGRIAAETLLNLVNDRPASTRVKLETTLALRDSLGSPKTSDR